jgi:hypothetical protein
LASAGVHNIKRKTMRVMLERRTKTISIAASECCNEIAGSLAISLQRILVKKFHKLLAKGACFQYASRH